MPHVIVSDRAQAGIEHCQAFLRALAPNAAKRARQTIFAAIKRLGEFPNHGRPYYPIAPEDAEEGEDLRELIIPFGRGGYLALYHYAKEENAVHIIAFKHGKEARYY